jgi:hypothetical protein
MSTGLAHGGRGQTFEEKTMSMRLDIGLRPDERFEISVVYPELNSITFRAGGNRFSLSGVPLEHMLELVKGNRVTNYVSLLSSDNVTHGKSHTKQDIIDFIEELLAERELMAKVKAKIKADMEQGKAPLREVEDGNDASAV